jgi:hypothetical protein
MRFSWTTVVVLLVGVLIRGGMLLLTPTALETDPDGYRRLAENLVAHGTFGELRPAQLSPRPPAGEGPGVRAAGTGTGSNPSSNAVVCEPTAYRPPLYPLLLAGCLRIDGRTAIGLLHVLLGVGTVALTLLLGRAWGLGRNAAAAAALLVACDPILLAWSMQVMTETPAALLAAAGLLALTWAGCTRAKGDRSMFSAGVGQPKTSVGRKMDQSPAIGRAFFAGFILGLGTLCRPVLLSATILAGAALAIMAFRRAMSHSGSEGDGSMFSVKMDRSPGGSHCSCEAAARAGGVLAMFALGAIIVLGPWAVRNQIQFGRPIVTTTHGGYTLYLANNPDFYRWLRTGEWGSVWWSKEFDAAWEQRRPRDELQADRMAYQEALQTIRREPASFAEACLVRLGRFWSPLPHQITPQETSLRRWSRYGVALWYAVEFALAVVFCGAAVSAAKDRRDACAANRIFTGTEAPVGKIESIKNTSCRQPSPSPWFWGLLFVVCLTAAHTVYWTDMRMRAPVMPVVALAAAAGGAKLLNIRKNKNVHGTI